MGILESEAKNAFWKKYSIFKSTWSHYEHISNSLLITLWVIEINSAENIVDLQVKQLGGMAK